jgi:PAS domain S-box-containing protein
MQNTIDTYKDYKARKRFLNRVVWGLIILFSAAVITANFYYNRYRVILKDEAHRNLLSISELKSTQLQGWIKERISNGNIIMKNEFLTGELENFENKAGQEEKKEKIRNWFSSLISEYGYKSVRLLDTAGNMIFSVPEKAKEPGEYMKYQTREAVRTKEVALSDFHFYSKTDTVHIDLMVPIVPSSEMRVKRVMTLEIDPEDYIYPLIQRWPTESHSGENILLEERDNKVLILNELRHIKNTALKLTIDRNETDILEVKAINGLTGLAEGIDYIGNKVLGVVKPVSGTKWILISKTDKDEIYGNINLITIWFAIILSSLLAGIFVLIVFYISRIKLYHRLEEAELQSKKESLERYYDIFKETTNDIMALCDTEGNILDVNDNALKKYKCTREEIRKYKARDVRAPGAKDDFDETFRKIIENGGSRFETIHRSLDRREFPVEVSAKVFTLNGTEYIQFIIQDITQRKEYEDKIRHLNRVYAVLSHVNHMIVYEKDRNTIFRKLCEIAVEQGEFIMSFFGLADEDTDNIIPIYSSGKDDGYTRDIKISISDIPEGRGPSGTAIRSKTHIVCNDIESDEKFLPWREKALQMGYKSMIAIPIFCQGRVIGVFNIFSETKNYFLEDELNLIQEISNNVSYALDVIEKEKERLQTAENFKTLFENASDAIILLEEERFLLFNKQAEVLYGLSAEELSNSKPYELSPERQPDGRLSEESAREYINNAYGGTPQRFEWTHTKPDKTEFITEVNLNRVIVENKPMLLAIVRDISTRKKAEQKLIEAKEFAEEANRIKTNFLNNMSHEIRTPLNIIIGYSDMLKEVITDTETLRIVEIIKSGSMRLLNTLNMILKLSQIESKKILINITSVDIVKSAEEIVNFYTEIANKKNLSLILDVKQRVSSPLDKDILYSILSNLVHNAITYTKEGFVKIQISREKTDDREYSLIKVIDTGIGIPSELIDIIFEPFRQVSEGYGRAFEGTGLGLTLAKKYVDLMHGKISVSSKVGKGSTFTLKFPVTGQRPEKPKSKPKKSILPSDKDKVKVLIVEDDYESLEYTRIVLRSTCDIDTTDTGEEAIEMAKATQYEIVIMDIGLKGMSGLEAVKAIRGLEGYKDIPIIAITAFALKGDKEKILAGGCTHYISKPFTPSELRSVLSGYMKK